MLEKLVWAKQNTIKSSTCFRLNKGILYFRCNISRQLIWLASKISSHIKRPNAYQLIHSNLLSNSWRGSGNLITTSTVTRESIRGIACLQLRELGLQTGVCLLLCLLQRSQSQILHQLIVSKIFIPSLNTRNLFPAGMRLYSHLQLFVYCLGGAVFEIYTRLQQLGDRNQWTTWHVSIHRLVELTKMPFE